MATRKWKIEAPDGPHIVELNHGYFSGRRIIKVDGKLVEQSANFNHLIFDVGSGHHIEIGGQTYILTIQPNMLTLGCFFRYEFKPAFETASKQLPPIPEP